jgi:hypothetical protein
MDVLLPYLGKWFLGKEEHFVAFAQADSRIEGWFKAELFVLLNRLLAQGLIESFEREANIPSPRDGRRKQVDFRFHIQEQEHLCELKSLCISRAAGTPRNLHFYFRDDHVGLIKVFKKLDELNNPNKWVLSFIYPNPNPNEWLAAISSLPRTLEHWNPVTESSNFPKWVYIALWKG